MEETTRPRDPKTGRFVDDGKPNKPSKWNRAKERAEKAEAELKAARGSLDSAYSTIVGVAGALSDTGFDPTFPDKNGNERTLVQCVEGMVQDRADAQSTLSVIESILEGTDYDPAHREQPLPACIRAMALDMSNAALRAKQVTEQAEADREQLTRERDAATDIASGHTASLRQAYSRVDDLRAKWTIEQGKSQSLRVVLVVVVLILASSLAVNALQFAAAGRAVVGGAK